MPLTSSAFKPYVEKWLAGIQEITDPMKGLGTVRADSKLVGDQLQEAKVRDYTHTLYVSDQSIVCSQLF